MRWKSSDGQTGIAVKAESASFHLFASGQLGTQGIALQLTEIQEWIQVSTFYMNEVQSQFEIIQINSEPDWSCSGRGLGIVCPETLAELDLCYYVAILGWNHRRKKKCIFQSHLYFNGQV